MLLRHFSFFDFLILFVHFSRIYDANYQKRWCKLLRKYLLMVLGATLFSLGFNLFLQPADIAPGGLSGVSLLINHFLPKIPIGVLTLLFNIPLFALGVKKLGGEFVRNTIFTTVLLSILLDAFAYLPPFTTEPVLAAIYGGLALGAGMGIAFLANSSTGGIDIAVRVIRNANPTLSIGQIMLIFDTAVALSAAIVFKNINSALYAIITMYVASIVLDALLYGQSHAKAAYIITQYADDISREISNSLFRGTTCIPCIGGFSRRKQSIVLCVVRRNQIVALKRVVHATDPDAFVIFLDAREVSGLGFNKNIL